MSNDVFNFPKDCSADAQDCRLKGEKDCEGQKESDRRSDIAGSALQVALNAIVVGSAASSFQQLPEGNSTENPLFDEENPVEQGRHSSLDTHIVGTAQGDPNDVLVSATASSFQQLPKGNAHVNPPDAAKGSDRIQDGSDFEEQKAPDCHGKNPERVKRRRLSTHSKINVEDFLAQLQMYEATSALFPDIQEAILQRSDDDAHSVIYRVLNHNSHLPGMSKYFNALGFAVPPSVTPSNRSEVARLFADNVVLKFKQ